MLIFTNRAVDPTRTDPSAFGRRFVPGSDTLACAQVARSAGGTFALRDVDAAVGDDAAMHRLVPLFRGPRPVLVYLHGNNNTPAACFERCARLEELYGTETLGFSWPSEGYLSSGDEPPGTPDPVVAAADDGDEAALARVDRGRQRDGWAQTKIHRYRQARLNAQNGGDALARFLRLLAAARLYAHAQPMTVAAHSLGCHFLQYTLQTETASEALGAAHHIVLLAACCTADGHEGWVGTLSPRGRVFVCYNRGDLVLAGAAIADDGRAKLGVEPGRRQVSPKVRYVSFTDSAAGFAGHAYFVRPAGSDVPKLPRRLFERLFASQNDLRPDEHPRKVYRGECTPDGSTCYLAASATDPSMAGGGG